MLDYSQCGDYAQATPLSNDQYEYTFSENVTVDAPTFHYQNASDFLDPSWGNPNNLTIKRCNIEFTIPTTMEGPIYMYYRLTNFYHNHRQYIKSFDADQLYGKQINPAISDCAPLAQGANGTVVYPCGLIANSLFNGKFKTCVRIEM
jgi:hypothetical protein